MNNLNIKRLTHITVLAFITLIISYQSLQSMRANTWYFNSLNILKQPKGLITSEDVQLADNAITLATKLEPTHPHYLQLSAYVKMLNLVVKNTRADEKVLIYDQVEQQLLKSLELRQAWSETWVALAQVVSYQEGPSERVYGYIQKAKKVGPYKFDTHLGIIQIILINWEQLPPKFKSLYVSELLFISKNFTHEFYRLLYLAEQIDKLPIFCLSLRFSNEYKIFRGTYKFKRHCELK